MLLELYYGGEAVSFEHAMSYTCPYCGSMGFSESQLQDHVNVEHADSSIEVVRRLEVVVLLCVAGF